MFEMQAPDWIKMHYSPEYTRYLTASLSPTTADATELAAAREALHATPIVAEILGTQRADGGWTPSPGEWYKGLPSMLGVLLDYGFTLLDEPVVRAIRYMLSLQRDDGSFRLDTPDAIPYDEAYNAGCIRAAVRAGLRNHPAIRKAAERLLAARRWDGGWSTLPPWMREPGVPVGDPEPSCPICTDLAIQALGLALDLPAALRDEFLEQGLAVIETLPPADRANQCRDRLGFMTNQGRRAGDPRVNELIEKLEACRNANGHFPHFESPADYIASELAEVLTRHLLWRLGYRPVSG
jgi:hypothetical protein